MKKINLRKYYPVIYFEDTYIDVADEIADVLLAMLHTDHAYYARVRYNRAYYSLNRNDGIEEISLELALSAEQEAENEHDKAELYFALLNLPKKQACRVYARYFLCQSISTIAKFEGVQSSTISRSLKKALKNLRRRLV